MTQEPIVITGLGIVSPIGIGKDTFWRNLIDGKNGISGISSFDTSPYPTHYGGEVKDFDPDQFLPGDKVNNLTRASQFVVVASKMALEDAGLNGNLNPERVGVCIGSTNGNSPLMVKMAKQWIEKGPQAIDRQLIKEYPHIRIPADVADEFGFKGGISLITTACAAGNYAIGYPTDLLRIGRADVMLAGSVEPFSQSAFTGFNRLMAVAPKICQPFDKNRKGMIISEGAGMLVLETLTHAKKRGAQIYAEIASYGLACDAYHMTAPHTEGKGAIRAIEAALKSARLAIDDIDYINAHGTGTPANDKVETLAIKKVFGERAKKIPISSIKSMLGHTLGAASSIEAVASALVIKNQIIPPTINYFEADPECDLDYVPNVAREQKVNIIVSNSFAFGGNCSALILKKFN